MNLKYEWCLHKHHIIAEYRRVLRNITPSQTKVYTMAKYLVFVVKQTSRRPCCTFQIFRYLKKPKTQMILCCTQTQGSRRYSSTSLTLNKHITKASCSNSVQVRPSNLLLVVNELAAVVSSCLTDQIITNSSLYFQILCLASAPWREVFHAKTYQFNSENFPVGMYHTQQSIYTTLMLHSREVTTVSS